jgi:hypothetical protein
MRCDRAVIRGPISVGSDVGWDERSWGAKEAGCDLQRDKCRSLGVSKRLGREQRAAGELLKRLPVEGRQMLGGTRAQPHRAAPMSTVNFELLRLGTSSRRTHGDDVAGWPGCPASLRYGPDWTFLASCATVMKMSGRAREHVRALSHCLPIRYIEKYAKSLYQVCSWHTYKAPHRILRIAFNVTSHFPP